MKRLIDSHYSAWKPLVYPAQDNPITVCDYFSTRKNDLVTIEYHPTPDYAGEYYALRYHKDQRWFWLSDQTADEMLLFLSYDSHPGNGLRCMCSTESSSMYSFPSNIESIVCPHTAFMNPLAPKDALPRESIEARLIVITRIGGSN